MYGFVAGMTKLVKSRERLVSAKDFPEENQQQ